MYSAITYLINEAIFIAQTLTDIFKSEKLLLKDKAYFVCRTFFEIFGTKTSSVAEKTFTTLKTILDAEVNTTEDFRLI